MQPLRILSVNVANPRTVRWKGKAVSTGIFKQPVPGRRMLRRLNLDGDRQADLSVHGGPEKAVYGYPSEHYELWRQELAMDLGWGAFGENLTLAGATENTVSVGDRYRIGRAVVMVTQPRVPCFKLAIKFGRDDIIKHFLESGRSGFYFSVVEEGELGEGDEMELVEQEEGSLSIAEVNHLYLLDKKDGELMERAVRLQALPANWRAHFAERLHDMGR